MNLGNVWIVFRKEFLDVLRDRRTLISMILLPIVIFPLLTAGLGSLVAGQICRMERRSSPIVVLGGRRMPELVEALQQKPELQVITTIEDSALALEMLDDKTIYAILCVLVGAEEVPGSGAEVENADQVQIWYDDSQPESGLVESKVRRALIEYREQLIHRELENRGLSYRLVEPFRIESVNRASQSQMAGAFLGMMLPYFVILLMMVGCTYPAIDLTAGEKERGTMETLLVSPASRLELVLGKFLTTMLVGMITTVLAVISLSYSFLGTGALIAQEAGGDFHFALDPLAYGLVVLLLIPIAALLAAALIAIAVNARSYKEAQSYVYPLIILVIIPAIASMLPGVEADMRMALIPVLNVSLTLRDALFGHYDVSLILLTFLSSALYAAFAIFIAVRIFQKESVLLRT